MESQRKMSDGSRRWILSPICRDRSAAASSSIWRMAKYWKSCTRRPNRLCTLPNTVQKRFHIFQRPLSEKAHPCPPQADVSGRSFTHVLYSSSYSPCFGTPSFAVFTGRHTLPAQKRRAEMGRIAEPAVLRNGADGAPGKSELLPGC